MWITCTFSLEPTATAAGTGHPANAVWILATLTPWHCQERLCHGSVLNTTRNVALALPEDPGGTYNQSLSYRAGRQENVREAREAQAATLAESTA